MCVHDKINTGGQYYYITFLVQPIQIQCFRIENMLVCETRYTHDNYLQNRKRLYKVWPKEAVFNV